MVWFRWVRLPIKRIAELNRPFVPRGYLSRMATHIFFSLSQISIKTARSKFPVFLELYWVCPWSVGFVQSPSRNLYWWLLPIKCSRITGIIPWRLHSSRDLSVILDILTATAVLCSIFWLWSEKRHEFGQLKTWSLMGCFYYRRKRHKLPELSYSQFSVIELEHYGRQYFDGNDDALRAPA